MLFTLFSAAALLLLPLANDTFNFSLQAECKHYPYAALSARPFLDI